MKTPELYRHVEVEPKVIDTFVHRKGSTSIINHSPMEEIMSAISSDIENGHYAAFRDPSIFLYSENYEAEGKKPIPFSFDELLQWAGNIKYVIENTITIFENLNHAGKYDFYAQITREKGLMRFYVDKITLGHFRPFCDVERLEDRLIIQPDSAYKN